MKTATITARIEPEIKTSAEKVFQEIGLSASDAITIFYKKVARDQKIPFSLTARPRLPSFDGMTEEEIRAELQDAYEEAQTGPTYPLETIKDLIKSYFPNANLQD